MKIILHNSEARESRELVASIPKNEVSDYIVIDWYKQHAIDGHKCVCVNGQPYEGPDPSCFPEIVFFEENLPDLNQKDVEGKDIVIKQADGWSRIRAATSLDITDRSKIDARKTDVRPRIDRGREEGSSSEAEEVRNP